MRRSRWLPAALRNGNFDCSAEEGLVDDGRGRWRPRSQDAPARSGRSPAARRQSRDVATFKAVGLPETFADLSLALRRAFRPSHHKAFGLGPACTPPPRVPGGRRQPLAGLQSRPLRGTISIRGPRRSQAPGERNTGYPATSRSGWALSFVPDRNIQVPGPEGIIVPCGITAGRAEPSSRQKRAHFRGFCCGLRRVVEIGGVDWHDHDRDRAERARRARALSSAWPRPCSATCRLATRPPRASAGHRAKTPSARICAKCHSSASSVRSSAWRCWACRSSYARRA